MDTKSTLTHALSTLGADAFQAGAQALANQPPHVTLAKMRADWIKDRLEGYVGPLLSQLAPPPVQGESDLWHYDAGARLIADQNGLAVARDVGPDDARVILSMQRGLLRIASPYEGADKGSDRAGAFNECAAVARSALDGNETAGLDAEDLVKSQDTEPMHTVLRRLLAYQAEAFETNGAVDYQDVTAFFAKIREDLKAAMLGSRKTFLPPVQVVVHVDGGAVNEVYADRLVTGLEVTVIDYDTNGSSSDFHLVTCDRGGIDEAKVSYYQFDKPDNVSNYPLIQEVADDEED